MRINLHGLINFFKINMKTNEYQLAEIQVSYNSNLKLKQKITSGDDAFKILLHNWNLDTIELQEEFKVVLLNKANIVLGIYPMSRGGTAGTVVDVKLLFSVLLKCNASAIIISHNHPSGNLKPSLADEKITLRIKECANLLDITLLDHLIITKDGYYSFSNEKFI